MDDLVSQLPLVLILSAGIFVQSAAGFAAGLMIVPALLWCGYSIPEAQASLLVATIPQNVWGVWSLRDSITVRQVAMPGLTRVLFFPVGVLVLQMLETFSIITLRQIVGVAVLTATLAIMFIRPTPRHRIEPFWAFLTFPTSGFLQGLLGMGGPVMVFWIQAHDWGTRRMRAFMFAMYLISIAPALAILYLFFGDRIVRPGVIAAFLIPLLLLVSFYGLRFGSWLGTTRLRRVTLWLLLLMGLAGLAAPWLSPPLISPHG